MTRADRHGAPGRVRIVAGTLRGSVLAVPAVPGLRPTPARARETLFNWLHVVLPGANCLDMFAGTGALGVEALSRGAASVCFIERDRDLAAALRANLARLRQPVQVHCGDALAVLREQPRTAIDIAFLDPPFAGNLWAQAAAQLEASGWLAPRAWIYVETPRNALFTPPAAWDAHRSTRSGEVVSTLYRRREAD